MKRFATLLLVVAALAIFVAGCSAPTPEVIEKQVIVEKEVPVTVEIVKEVVVEVEVAPKVLVFESTLFSPPREQEFFINEVLKPFEEEHGVSIHFQILAGDVMLDRTEVQQTTGHVTTDVVITHNSTFPDWHDAGWAQDMTPLVDSWTDRHFSPTFLTDTNRDGKQYFLPVAADVYVLLANNKALPYVPDGVDIDAITWEQYAQWAVNIAEGEGEGKVCITGIPSNSWIYQFGGSALSYGAGFPDANSAAAMEAWKIWETIGKAGGFVPTVLSVNNCTEPMMREESWLSVFHVARVGPVYASNETQFTVAPAPSGPTGIGSIAGVSGYTIVKGAPNYDLAVKFLEYVTRPEIAVKIAKGTGGFIPPVQEAIDYMGDEAIDKVVATAVLVLETGVASGVPASLYQDWGAVKKCFDDVFEDTILAGNDIDQARIDEAQACVDGLLK